MTAVNAALAEWQQRGNTQRLWRGDTALWTSSDEDQWLGWLGIVDEQLGQRDAMTRLAGEIRSAGFTHAVLLGMGGSSLCPEVLRMTFGTVPGFPELLILDSTDPARIRAIEAHVDLTRTLFIVSSKSGSTLEPNIFMQYFFERVKSAVGDAEAGRRFIAITDPGSHLQRAAEENRFRHIFAGVPSIGGRYSALSAFGTVPAAIMGLDVKRFLQTAKDM